MGLPQHIILSPVVVPDSGALAPLQASEVIPHLLSQPRAGIPRAFILLPELAPHQLGPTAEGHFSLKLCCLGPAQGDLGPEDEAQPGCSK